MSAGPDSKELQELLERHRRSEELFREIVSDPQSYFRRENRRNWKTPNPAMGNEWTYRWSSWLKNNLFQDHAQSHAAFQWSKEWPLPIGRASLRSHVSEMRTRDALAYSGDQSFLASLMPFEREELALGIFDSFVADCRIEAFCLGSPVDGLSGLFRPSEVAFRITTIGSHEHPEIKMHLVGIQDWWRKCARQPVYNGGRPPGTAYPLDMLREKYRAERSEGRARTLTEFAITVGINDRHLSRLLAPSGGWKALKDEA